MKLYQKKNASLEDETVLMQLERRHTLKEDADEANSENLRKTVRANSLGSFGEGNSSIDVEAVTTEKQSGFTRKPTVITENELSSSWLYKDRKAKINSDDEGVEDPRPTMSHEDHEDLEPRTLHDPKLKPASVPHQRSRKMSSCCWYFTIILIICIACLAVMAGVGGIVYLEYFAIYSEKDIENTNASEKIDSPSASKGILEHSTHKQDNFQQNEPQIPENILRDILKNSTILARIISRKVTTASSPPNDIFHNKDLLDSKSSKADELNKVKSSFVSENQGIEPEHPKTAEHLDISRNIPGRFNQFNPPVSDKFVEIKSNAKNKDSLDLNLNIQNIDNTIDKTPDENVDKVSEHIIGDESIVTEKSNSKTQLLDSGEEALVSGRIFNFDEMTALQGIQLKGEKVNTEVSFRNLPGLHLLSDISLDHMENSIDDNHDASSFYHMENSIDDNHEDNSFDRRKHAIDHDSKDNSLDETVHSIDHSPENESLDAEHSIASNNKSLNDHNEDSSDFDSNNSSSEHSQVDDQNRNSDDNSSEEHSQIDDQKHNSDGSSSEEHSQVDSQNSDDNSSEEHSQVDNQNQNSDDRSSEVHSQVDDQNQNSDDNTQLVFIRPIVESKAVPIPLAFLRRIGFDIKNPDSHQPMTAEDMDIKFSLAEALKYLRSLDTENKLPVSREKTLPHKASNQTEIKKTKLPLKSERGEYLNLLRKQIFE